MKRATIALAVCLLTLALAAPARAAFGIHSFGIAPVEEGGSAATQAGSHPFAVSTTLGANFEAGTLRPEGWLRDFLARTPPGLVGDTTAYPRCATAQFLEPFAGGIVQRPNCPPETQVGAAGVALKPVPESPVVGWEPVPVFNVAAPPGVLLRLGFRILTQNTFIDITLNPEPPYNATAASRNTPQAVEVLGAKVELWGNPSDPAHDEQRTPCGPEGNSPAPEDVEDFQFEPSGASCPVKANPKPFLTLPTQCNSPLLSSYEARSWEGDTDQGSAITPALKGCGKLNFKPAITSQPTSQAAASPSGLNFELSLKDEGLTSTSGLAASQTREAVVTLPEGMTINPSQAEGLAVCSEADLGREKLAAEPGEGCPQASKVGTVQVESPLVAETIAGSLYVAEPYANLADDSLVAVYLVIKNHTLGVIVKQPLKITPDPRTGQLVTTAKDIPQLPFSSFRLRFREGGRSPLITPPLCGAYETKALLYPYSGNPPVQKSASFQIGSGPNGSPCPPAGMPPFEPGFSAGTLNNSAGSYSPFAMRLTRRDADQDLVRFDATLPPGVVAKLTGVEKCPEAQIAQIKHKSGRQELASPSCPAASKIGSVMAGAGAGSQLTYVPGSVYLAGPFAGAPLSVVGVVPAVAGPFDVGVVATRQALDLDPVTGEVKVDGARSEPIPHILAGIPLAVRDIQVAIDRPQFTLNPTDCSPFATQAALWGGGLDPFSLLDDSPIARLSRFQAADCAALGFAPRLSLKLKGGTGRGANPALRAVLRPRPDDANPERAVVRLPRSAFLDQGHIRTICTRVQFAQDACPPDSVYGRVEAFTPLLAEPLRGPAILRSSDNNLPDLVFDLHGTVDIEASGRIDSVGGGIRASFAGIPDAPVSKVVVNMQGQSKGLIVNSTDLCRQPNRARLVLGGQNGRRHRVRPVVGVRCKGAKKGRKGHSRAARH
jgi:hypothetical protein